MKNINNMDKTYIINPNYILVNDNKRVYLTYRYNPLPIFNLRLPYETDTQFFSFIHPEQAKLFALFDGNRKLTTIIDEIAKRLNVSTKRAYELILPYIENKTRLGVAFQNNRMAFPSNFLVPKKENIKFYTYEQNDFICNSDLDLISPRINSFPLDITFMVNTICQTDCIYCYADCRKKMDCQIPIESLDRLITDCKKNNVRSFNLMGGEVLLYKNWKWLVKRLIESDYMPYISTKIPVEKEIVQTLYDIGINQIQISLDSFDDNILEKNLNIPNGSKYIDKMKRTLKYFEEANITLNLHAVITKYNKDIPHLEQYLNTLSTYSHISNVELSVVGESLYKKGYHEFKLCSQDVKIISDYVDSVKQKKKYPFTISFSPGTRKEMFKGNKKIKKDNFEKRPVCSGNVRLAYILPTGEVTICEGLMFNPQFILGNIIKDDLETIWKNNRLRPLYSPGLYENTPCGKCKEFMNCRTYESKRGVCWKIIIHAYGEKKWNYPDPRCSSAPTQMNPFYPQ